MEIVEIYKDWLYSINFDEEDLNEYQRVFREWHDLDYLVRFFSENKDNVNSDFWKNAGLDPDNPEKSAERVIDEANSLETYIREIVDNCSSGTKPDFDEYFHFLGGKYKCLWSLEPVKSYGTDTPSLLRFYAIKMDTNCYLIVYGYKAGLYDTKLASPGNPDNTWQKFRELQLVTIYINTLKSVTLLLSKGLVQK